MIELRKYTDVNVVDGCNIALKNRLYVSGWQLSYTMKDIRDKMSNRYDSLAIAYENEKPVSVVVFGKTGCVQAFTKKQHRRKGFASLLIEHFKINILHYDEGIEGSFNFWEKVSGKA